MSIEQEYNPEAVDELQDEEVRLQYYRELMDGEEVELHDAMGVDFDEEDYAHDLMENEDFYAQYY